jgi:hypothetical protein
VRELARNWSRGWPAAERLSVLALLCERESGDRTVGRKVSREWDGGLEGRGGVRGWRRCGRRPVAYAQRRRAFCNDEATTVGGEVADLCVAYAH